jgi:NAD(P)H-nitrite reductase large subunit
MGPPSTHYVIIGNSAAGLSAAKEIRRRDPTGKITMVSDEKTFGYSRVMLPLYIAGMISKKAMVIAPGSFYRSERVRLLRGDPAVSIDPCRKNVHLQAGRDLSYDQLLIATGASPKTLDLPGKELLGVYPLRKIVDAEKIRQTFRSSKGPVLIIGGGLVGIKSLEALLSRKREIHLVISSDRVFSQILDKTASDYFCREFDRRGVRVHFRTEVKAFQGRGRLERALLSDGSAIHCDLAILGKGVQPNTEFLKGTGIALKQGVIVNGRMAANLSSIYAAGDVAEPPDLFQGENIGNPIWPSAAEGGRIAGSNMAGIPALFSRGLRMNSVEVLGIRAVSVGRWEGREEAAAIRKEGAIYRKLVFSEGRLTGFILLGDIRCAGVLTSLVRSGTGISLRSLERDLDRGVSYRPKLFALGGSVAASGGGREIEDRS